MKTRILLKIALLALGFGLFFCSKDKEEQIQPTVPTPTVPYCPEWDKMMDVKIISPEITEYYEDTPVFTKGASVNIKVRISPRKCTKMKRIVIEIRRLSDKKLVKTITNELISQEESHVKSVNYIPTENGLFYVIAKGYAYTTTSVDESKAFFTVMNKFTPTCATEISFENNYQGTKVRKNQYLFMDFSYSSYTYCNETTELRVIVWKRNSAGEYVFKEYLDKVSYSVSPDGLMYKGYNRQYSEVGKYLVEARIVGKNLGVKSSTSYHFEVTN